MKNKMVELLLVLHLISVCIGVNPINPCVDYAFIYMANGLRSSDFNSSNSQVSLCDAFLDPAIWYRFEHDAGNRLIERPVAPWHCGTQAPIWLNGTHPTDRSEVTVGVCATFSSANKCGWNGMVRIRLCNESGSNYFVYLLAVPPGCPLSYCVDAASRKACTPPDVWLEREFRCGVSETTTGHSTVPLTKPTTLSTLATTSSSTTERQRLAPTSSSTTERQSLAPTSSSTTERQSLAPTLSSSTEPASTGWSTCGPWSVCSKQCDYGFQSCRRTCSRLPCIGSGSINRLCNEYKCQSLPEEKTIGIGLFFQGPASKEDTMLKVVLYQQKIHDIIRENINDICSQNVSMCCGWRYNGISPLRQEFVLSSDLHPAQGSLELRTDNSVYYQVIAVVNEDFDRTICKGHSQRNYTGQVESSPNFLSFDVMLMASVHSVGNIYKETGLIMTANRDHVTTTTEVNVYEASCPGLKCVLPIVLCIAVGVLVTVIAAFCFAKSKLRTKTEPVAPSPEPPNYYEVLAADCRGLPDYATDISPNEYERAI